MTSSSSEIEEVAVRGLLRVAGLAPSDAEVADLVAAYPVHRQAVERLYAVAMPKEMPPQPVFVPMFTTGGRAGDGSS